MKLRTMLCFVLGAIGAMGGVALAGAATQPGVPAPSLWPPLTSGTDNAKLPAGQVDFREGAYTVTTYISNMTDVTNRQVRLTSGVVSLGYYLYGNVSLNVEASGCYTDEPGPQTGGVGIDLLLRQHMLVQDKWSFFWDVGPGVLENGGDVPPDGTRFNITFRTGPGFTIKLKENTHLIIGARYYHLSNAKAWGSDRNPSVNGVEAYVGLLIAF